MYISGVNAINKNTNLSEKELDDSIACLERKIENNKKRKSIYVNNLNIVSKRKFPRKISKKELEGLLSNMTLKQIFLNTNDINSKLDRAEDSEQASIYKQIIEINASLGIIYNEKTNKEYFKLLKRISPGILTKHKDEFKTLSANIRDYRFLMFELADVINSIHSMAGELEGDLISEQKRNEISNKLDANGDMKYINENDYPYIYNCVDRYITNWINEDVEGCDEILSELKESCPDAFSDIKSPKFSNKNNSSMDNNSFKKR